ncbi:MAG: DNA polymerase III subunit gamma/tau, partial [Chloroflexota bacterium]
MSHQPQSDARSLYHRWRSRSFSEVVAQEHVTRTLKNAVGSGRIVHAYLFCGPRGTGKTSTARILAKAVNCLDPQQGEPCNRCASCEAVSNGRAIDLIEIDAASNRGIDDARDLREKIKYSPAESRYKVYIIDEAHMLTSEASNALLKTLEEPPEHAILILATTESQKILPTISSRCQRFDFRRIPLQAISQQLGMISEREGLMVEPAVLDRVARLAKGSLRDAESLLDQLVAYCGEEIGLEAAREVLGLTGEEAVPEFAEALRGADLARGLRLIDRAASTGADLRHFSRELLDYLRALMVAKSGADTSVVREYRFEELERLRATAAGWGYQQLLSGLRTFGDLEGRMRQEAFNQLQLEIAFMEAAMAATPETPSAEAHRQSGSETEEPGRGAVPASAASLTQAASETTPPPQNQGGGLLLG